MRLAMTLMVRDEADIIVPMIEYHLSAGVDVMIITDNGSCDGTREILAQYDADPRIVVMDEPAHDGNQAGVVTRMARLAATEFAATWVINADADEFFVPVDRTITLGEAFAAIPVEIASATVPVIDMTGVPAREGTGLARLIYRDQREEESLYLAAGLHAHATHDAVHVAAADVNVSHGNHFVSIASRGSIPGALQIESLHFPWRSYAQFSRKVNNAGQAYSSNRSITPSPRHHGMRDYRFARAGVLEEIYLYRHPSATETPSEALPADTWLLGKLRSLVDEPTTLLADALRVALDDTHDEPYTDFAAAETARIARAVLLLEDERADAAISALAAEESAVEARARVEQLQNDNAELSREVERFRREPFSRLVRVASRVLMALTRPLRRNPGRR